MKNFTLFVLLFCTSTFIFAQYNVGVRQLNIKDNSRLRNINTFVYYPATADSNNAPIIDDGTKFPVISFGHGFVMSSLAYQWLVEALVPQGYIIGFPATEEGIPNHLDFGKDEAVVARTLKNYGDSISSFLYQKTNGYNAVGGHSMGGGASFLGMNNVTDITTFFNFSAAETFAIYGLATDVAKTCVRPALVFTGSKDCVAPPVGNSKTMYQNLKSEYKFFANIKDGSHCQFADANKTPCEAGETLACLGTTYISRINQQTRVLSLLKPWLDFWLKRDCNAISTFYANSSNNITTIDTLQSKIIDCSALSIATAIKQNKTIKANLFPNPSSGLFTLEINQQYTNATLQIFDVTGKLIDEKNYKNQNFISLDYSYLAKGLYQLQLKTENGNYFSKIVIE